MSPSTVCPMPQGHTYSTVKSAYDKARKANPTLTPAAWRKAAAQELGMPYDDFLKLWKTKGKVPGYPASSPTKSAAQSPGPGMGLTAPKPAPGLNALQKTLLDDVDGSIASGVVTKDTAIAILEDMIPKANFTNGELAKVQAALKKLKAATKADEAAAKLAQEAALDVIDTELGPLTHDLAQGIYKQMKANMPDATPAVWRKAAADYLNVDYKEYLKAWKKPTTAAQKAKTLPKSQWPPVDPPVVPTQIGKYSGQTDYNIGDLKTDLASLLGPDGNAAYIVIDRADFVGQYLWKIPQSIVNNQAAREAIAKRLEAMGFQVDLQGAKLKFWTKSAADSAKKAANVSGADTFTQTIVVASNEVWETASASKWSHRAWGTLTRAQKGILQRYSGSYYTTVNNMLRGFASDFAGVAEEARIMSSAMVRMDHGFTVFRGVDFSISEFKVGSLWTDKGFVSTSIDRSAGFSSHKPTKMIIEVPPGTKGFYIGPNSHHPGELEFIIDSNTKFRVISVQGNTVRLVAIPK